MDRVDRIRLKVLQAAAEEARGWSRLNDALLELAVVVEREELEVIHRYCEAAREFAAKRKAVLDRVVDPHVRRLREGML